MRTLKDLSEVKAQLPQGAIKAISKRSGIGYYTVLRILNGDTKSVHLGDVINATAEYLTELKGKEKKALKALNRALNIEPIQQTTLP